MSDRQILFEQYKLYVQMADNISERRNQTNRFYITLLSGLFTVLAIAADKNFFLDYKIFSINRVAILAVCLKEKFRSYLL